MIATALMAEYLALERRLRDVPVYSDTATDVRDQMKMLLERMTHDERDMLVGGPR